MFRVGFFENGSDAYWYADLVCLPMIGARIELDQAPKGHFHRVQDIIHRIGGGEHRIEIRLDFLDPTATN
ncbi:MAG: hypothetical protein F8N36_13635 [Desulfovibrio sp.]|uniref:hypothetical protein n=1 Tax=Desulfovibrio sp. TaxID=885 RepID=UPI00135D2510|nr:hypothetical protein [Desulfovibrio sp.]MTJ93881.1 hypothetical protein [Desulfovibrio sp.]